MNDTMPYDRNLSVSIATKVGGLLDKKRVKFVNYKVKIAKQAIIATQTV